MTIENAIYINDGHTVNGETVDFASAILDGIKKGETRTHKSLTRKPVGIVHDGYIIGRVQLGDPQILTRDSAEYANSLIEGTEYDIQPDQIKYYYPIIWTEDFRKNPKPVLQHGNYAKYILD